MKKINLLLTLLLCASFSFAQVGIELGGHLTPQSTWILNGDDFAAGEEMNHSLTWGMAFGFHAGLNFSGSTGNNTFGIQSGISWSKQGQTYKGDNSLTGSELMFPMPLTTIDDKASVGLSYLKIPVLFKFGPDAYNSGFLFKLGPQFGFKSGAKMTVDGTDYEESHLGFVGIETNNIFNGVDIGVLAYIGSRFYISEAIKVDVGFKFDYSLLDIENKDLEGVLLGIKGDYFNADRKGTKNGTAGLEIAVIYVLN